MVKQRIVVGAHYGLKDWIAQRATAVFSPENEKS